MDIRDATASDEARWRQLWAKYLEFYQTSLAPEVTNQTWAHIFDPASPLAARLVISEGKVMGFCLHHPHLSTWSARPDCYLEDLFLADSARGLGFGRALIDDLISICRDRGYARLYWQTDEGNSRARALYDSYTPTDGHVRYRIKI